MKKGDKVTWVRNFSDGGDTTSETMEGTVFKTYPKQPIWLVQTNDGELHSVFKNNLTLVQ